MKLVKRVVTGELAFDCPMTPLMTLGSPRSDTARHPYRVDMGMDVDGGPWQV